VRPNRAEPSEGGKGIRMPIGGCYAIDHGTQKRHRAHRQSPTEATAALAHT
jgi:hypothetical protein